MLSASPAKEAEPAYAELLPYIKRISDLLFITALIFACETDNKEKVWQHSKL
jgi:cob(I)alamin adenosyltransferase